MPIRPLVLALLLPCIAHAQLTDPRLPISLHADSTDYDGKSSMLMFTGLRLTQGNIGVEADEGRASKLDFENSVWRFAGNVVIDVENGHIECDSADLQFEDHRLKLATIEGTPATFELRRPGSEELTHAEAGTLRYDFDAGVIEFSGDASITEGGHRISSSLLVYNIREQRFNAQSSADGENKVQITYTPPDTAGDAPDDTETGDDAPADDDEPDSGENDP